jgi:transcriptional regulator with XRE-family HTH domain
VDGVSIGERVREERERRGWSARTLAQHAGVSHAYVSHLEAGQYSRPGIEKLGRIAGALGVKLESLAVQEAESDEEERAPKLDEIQVNLMAIRRLDPQALDHLAGIIAAVKDKVEREHGGSRRERAKREQGERRGQRSERSDTEQM